ncbi:MAG TPA: GDP-mannose 4,6-dehydratase [bacterium]
MKKKAFITGITGQDGSYLAEFLLEKNYEVHGLVHATLSVRSNLIDHLLMTEKADFFLHRGSLMDSGRLTNLFKSIGPDEVYNLAAQSNDVASIDSPEQTSEINGMAVVRLLESIRKSGVPARFFQASSAEMFEPGNAPLGEDTPLKPKSPYGSAKAFAHSMVANYRNLYKTFACGGILFNHESPRRSESFVTRKITASVSRIVAGQQSKLKLGRIDAKRDWGYAKDYVEAMWLMLQQPTPEDFVIATGETHSVLEFLEEAFDCAGLDYKKYIEFDQSQVRAVDMPIMRGDPSKANKKLGWKPKVDFKKLVRLMVDADLKTLGLKPPTHSA